MRDLRSRMKKRRLALTPAQVREASLEIAANAWQLPELGRCRRIAIYMAFRGEVDCQWLTNDAWLRKRAVFAPVLRDQTLVFAPLYPDSKLIENRFHILEPVCPPHRLVRPRDIDVVVVPLLAFDAMGNRLGMGTGYYDRSFGFLIARKKWLRPKLIGVAYSFQRVRRLRPDPWDVPLNTVVTESKAYRFR
jgi:5-formyltetrahydrofolate cyclo-ligase